MYFNLKKTLTVRSNKMTIETNQNRRQLYSFPTNKWIHFGVNKVKLYIQNPNMSTNFHDREKHTADFPQSRFLNQRICDEEGVVSVMPSTKPFPSQDLPKR